MPFGGIVVYTIVHSHSTFHSISVECKMHNSILIRLLSTFIDDGIEFQILTPRAFDGLEILLTTMSKEPCVTFMNKSYSRDIY